MVFISFFSRFCFLLLFSSRHVENHAFLRRCNMTSAHAQIKAQFCTPARLRQPAHSFSLWPVLDDPPPYYVKYPFIELEEAQSFTTAGTNMIPVQPPDAYAVLSIYGLVYEY